MVPEMSTRIQAEFAIQPAHLHRGQSILTTPLCIDDDSVRNYYPSVHNMSRYSVKTACVITSGYAAGGFGNQSICAILIVSL